MYRYLVGAAFFAVLWSLLFALLPRGRRAMLWSGLALGHLGPLSEYWHLKDYWNPVYLAELQIGAWSFGLEDYLFAFAFAGMGAGIFDLLARRAGQEELAKVEVSGFVRLAAVGLACLGAMGGLAEVFGINSLHGIAIAFLAGALLLFALHPRWMPAAVQTAFAMAGMVWLFYWGFYLRLFPGIIEEWWHAGALAGVFLGGVPIEEVIWAWSGGLFVGPVARYCLSQAPSVRLRFSLSLR